MYPIYCYRTIANGSFTYVLQSKQWVRFRPCAVVRWLDGLSWLFLRPIVGNQRGLFGPRFYDQRLLEPLLAKVRILSDD